MRADPNLYANVSTAMQLSESKLQVAVSQLSSGKRVATPSDDPLAFAANLRSLNAAASVDRYTQNTDAVTAQVQAADSALGAVVASLTRAVSLGTQGAGSDLTTAQRAALVEEVNGVLENVVASANQTSNGQALFGGTATSGPPFIENSAAPGSYLYQGSHLTNSVDIGTGDPVAASIPGDQIFQNASANVFGSLQQLASALSSADSTQIAQAVVQVTSAIGYVGQVRAQYSNTVAAASQQNDFLSKETITLTSQQQSLVGVDLPTAATALTQAQLGNSAVLAMAAKILPESLLNYLH